jgi:hypothetical protein
MRRLVARRLGAGFGVIAALLSASCGGDRGAPSTNAAEASPLSAIPRALAHRVATNDR